MKDNLKAGNSIYYATPTKYIIFTICAFFLIRLIHDVGLSFSKCDNIKKNANKVVEVSEKAYTMYQGIKR